jgi:hypothetical protein
MSELGHLRTFDESERMSGLPPEADVRRVNRQVGFGPDSDVSTSPSIKSVRRLAE